MATEREPHFYWLKHKGKPERALWTGTHWRLYSQGSFRINKILDDSNITDISEEPAAGPDGTKELLLLLINGEN